jgi:hypothetical protein
MTWIVIVTDHRNATLTGASAVSYESPPHREADARKLVELLSAGAASGEGPWRTRSPAAKRTIELKAAQRMSTSTAHAPPRSRSPSHAAALRQASGALTFVA